ncbi:dihydrofolate reductase [Candidatus Saccharibacteria bacterium oral taxon 955]|nr:dihydrofolate reductase [Candidatus Saccharibacteria bacterium oral taxon 955]
MKSIVVAYDRARGIGANNDLLWGRDLPADLQHFKDLTAGGSLIMGRKTFESIGRALPGRENIVVTHRPLDAVDVIAVDSLASAYRLAHGNQFIIGGASIYEQALSDVDVVYATEVDQVFPEAEVFFPSLGEDWQERSRESFEADDRNKYPYDFVTYVRIAK